MASTNATWKEEAYDTIDQYVEAARVFPDDIVNILHWATVECFFDPLTFVEVLVKNGVLDVNRYDYWPCDAHVKTTLLLSELEFRRGDMVRLLLRLGADVEITDEMGFNVIDTILHGHGYHDLSDPGRCVELLKIVMPYNPPIAMHELTLNEWRDAWTEYRNSEELNVLLARFW
jgi:hypothetical protein